MVDVTPTLVDLLGVPLPAQVNGVEQISLHGVSMARSFHDNDADTRKSMQYFEMVGHRGIWHGGWKTATFHQRGTDFDADVWELYHLDKDLAEIDDLANRYPEKLAARHPRSTRPASAPTISSKVFTTSSGLLTSTAAIGSCAQSTSWNRRLTRASWRRGNGCTARKSEWRSITGATKCNTRRCAVGESEHRYIAAILPTGRRRENRDDVAENLWRPCAV